MLDVAAARHPTAAGPSLRPALHYPTPFVAPTRVQVWRTRLPVINAQSRAEKGQKSYSAAEPQPNPDRSSIWS
jgi:hypothetical protein